MASLLSLSMSLMMMMEWSNLIEVSLQQEHCHHPYRRLHLSTTLVANTNSILYCFFLKKNHFDCKKKQRKVTKVVKCEMLNRLEYEL